MGKHSKRTPEQQALHDRLDGYKYNKQKKPNKEWHLTEEQAFSLFIRPCHFCGCPSDPLNLHGIDRVLNTLPYDLGNTMTCCRVCNRAKGAMTAIDFVDWIKRAYAKVTSPAFLQNTNIGLAAQSGTLRVHIFKNGVVRTATTRGMTTKEEREQP